MSLYHLFFRMEEASLWLLTKLEQAESTTPLDLPPAAGTPPRIDAKLYRAMQTERTFPPGNATRLIKAMAIGDLQELVIRVDRIFVAGGTATTKRSIIGVWKTELPNNVPVWLSDATADSEEIASIVGRPVVDATPEGTLEQQHAAIQIPVDIKQSTSPAKIVKIVQGFLADHPEAQRVGVITHREHVPMLKGTSRSGRGDRRGLPSKNRKNRILPLRGRAWHKQLACGMRLIACHGNAQSAAYGRQTAADPNRAGHSGDKGGGVGSGLLERRHHHWQTPHDSGVGLS